MKDYYQILGVDRGASRAAIKKSYRKLAKQFHPDKNPSAGAVDRFNEINEAYETLTDPALREAYDQGRQPVVAHPGPTTSRPRPPVYKAHQDRKKRAAEEIAFMKRYVRVTDFLAALALLFGSLLAVDFLLPSHTIKGAVLKVEGFTYGTVMVHIQEYGTLELKRDYAIDMLPGTQVFYRESMLFKIPASIAVIDRKPMPFRANIFGNLIFMPLIMLICSGAVFFIEPRSELRFNVGATCAILLLINALMLNV